MPASTMENEVPVLAKAAHINMMTDTIISSLPEEGLRSVMRSILVADPRFTKQFEYQSLQWLRKTSQANKLQLFISSKGAGKDMISPDFERTAKRIRAMIGCGLGFECLELLQQIVMQAGELEFDEQSEEGDTLMDILAGVDGEIVQAVTSAGKELLVAKSKRSMTEKELSIRQNMVDALEMVQKKIESKGMEFMFARGLSVMDLESF
jgi:hypothetical protein